MKVHILVMALFVVNESCKDNKNYMTVFCKKTLIGLEQKPRGYGRRFSLHIEKFLKQNNIYPCKGETVYLGLSGGADSMALLKVLLDLSKKVDFDLKLIHINHGLRNESSAEMQKLKTLSHYLGLTIKTFHVSETFESNIENELRNARYKIFNDINSSHSKFFLAHHLNDCFEWDMLMSLKSSTDTLGIPLKNGSFIRPFLCVSKKQILNFLDFYRIKYFEDKTNYDSRFERSYIRSHIVELEKRFPKYLKHYAIRKNRQLIQLKINRFHKEIYIDQFQGRKILVAKDQQAIELESLVKTQIQLISTDSRGTLGKEVVKFLEGYNRTPKGPHKFSGNVLGFHDGDGIYLIHESNLSLRDKRLKNALKDADIPVVSFDSNFINHSYKQNFLPIIGLRSDITKLADLENLEDKQTTVFKSFKNQLTDKHVLLNPVKLMRYLKRNQNPNLFVVDMELLLANS